MDDRKLELPSYQLTIKTLQEQKMMDLKTLYEFKHHMGKTLDEFFIEMDKMNDLEKFNVTIKLRDKEIEIPMNAELWENVSRLIQDEIDYEEGRK